MNILEGILNKVLRPYKQVRLSNFQSDRNYIRTIYLIRNLFYRNRQNEYHAIPIDCSDPFLNRICLFVCLLKLITLRIRKETKMNINLFFFTYLYDRTSFGLNKETSSYHDAMASVQLTL